MKWIKAYSGEIAFSIAFTATFLTCSAIETYFLHLNGPFILMCYGAIAFLLSICAGSACGSYVEDRREWNNPTIIK